jgi:hypothetical protein
MGAKPSAAGGAERPLQRSRNRQTHDQPEWIRVGPLSDGEDKNRTFVSWLDRAEKGDGPLSAIGTRELTFPYARPSANSSLQAAMRLSIYIEDDAADSDVLSLKHPPALLTIFVRSTPSS